MLQAPFRSLHSGSRCWVGRPLFSVLVAACVGTSTSRSEPPEVLVARLYKGETAEALLEQPHSALRRYFAEPLASLLAKDRDCVARTGEICELDFDPIWASQDPGGTDLTVVRSPASDVIRVRFRFPGNGAGVELDYQMIQTAEVWRVADIHYPSGPSLASILKAGGS